LCDVTRRPFSHWSSINTASFLCLWQSTLLIGSLLVRGRDLIGSYVGSVAHEAILGDVLQPQGWRLLLLFHRPNHLKGAGVAQSV
jgi:hypothetical protein